MKIYMRPVEMIAWFDFDKPRPIKFKLGDKVLKVEQVINFCEEKLAGNSMIVYRCQSEMNGKLKPFGLRFELQTCKWFLFKI